MELAIDDNKTKKKGFPAKALNLPSQAPGSKVESRLAEEIDG
jgi:hypothetical protein